MNIAPIYVNDHMEVNMRITLLIICLCSLIALLSSAWIPTTFREPSTAELTVQSFVIDDYQSRLHECLAKYGPIISATHALECARDFWQEKYGVAPQNRLTTVYRDDSNKAWLVTESLPITALGYQYNIIISDDGCVLAEWLE